MKKRTSIFCSLLFSSAYALAPFIENVNAEEYICSDVGGVERPTYTRINNNKFISTINLNGETSTSQYSVVNETRDFIVLVEKFSYRDAWTTVIDKTNKEYSETYTIWDIGKNPEVAQSFGPCLVFD